MNQLARTRLRLIAICSLIPVIACYSGCGTTINRVATEQLLLSDAVDDAVNQIDFSHFRGQRCYLDTSYLKQNQKTGIINTEYVVSSLRQQVVTAGALLQERRADADIVIEPRVGALGTDGHEIVYGVPQGGSIAGAATALSGSPLALPAIPEIALGKNDSQSGIAKLSVFAYDQVTRQPLWQSGIAKAETTSNNTWVLGAGPFQKGTVYEGLRFAGRRIPDELSLGKDSEYANSHQMERIFSKTTPVQQHASASEKHDLNTDESNKNKAQSVTSALNDAPSPAIRAVNHEETIPMPTGVSSRHPLRPVE